MSSTAFVNGSTLSDAGWANDTDTVTYAGLTSPAGTNTITATGPVSMTAYAARQVFAFIPAATNTGATTLNITPSGASALGAKNIFWNGVACAGGEIIIGVPCRVFYDGTQFNLMGPVVKGTIIQSVQGVLTATYSQASATFTAITSLSAALAALKSTRNRVKITVNLGKVSTNMAVAATTVFRLMRDATPIGVGDAASNRLQGTFGVCSVSANANYAEGGYNYTYIDSPAGVGAYTYTLQMATEGGVQAYINRTYSDADDAGINQARTISSLLAEEIAG